MKNAISTLSGLGYFNIGEIYSGIDDNFNQLIPPDEMPGGDYKNFHAMQLQLQEVGNDYHIIWNTSNNSGSGSLFYVNNASELQVFNELGLGRISGVEFSPFENDDLIVYLSCTGEGDNLPGIYRFNIDNEYIDYISGSENFGYSFLQIGPDNNIYALHGGPDDNYCPYLGRIDETSIDTEAFDFAEEGAAAKIVVDYKKYYILPENDFFPLAPPLVVAITTEPVTCPYNPDGEATVTVSGGTLPYSYFWEQDIDGIWTDIDDDDDTAEDLAVGTYRCTITDEGSSPPFVTEDINIEYSDDIYVDLVIIDASTPDWNTVDYKFLTGLKILDGADFTISNSTLQFDQDAEIIIENGATLTLNNTNSTNLLNCGGMWEGIQVWGIQSSSNPEDQGKLVIYNNSSVENAKTGIRNYWPEPQHWGGIVEANNVDFINNEISVDFQQYNYTNQSWFTNSNFTVNANFMGTTFTSFVKLRYIDGPIFNNCTFQNLDTEYTGIGIDAINATFNVAGPNTFENLLYGIKATNTGITNGSTIELSTFTNNYRSVYISSIDNMEITDNTFNIPPDDPMVLFGALTYGAYMDYCTGYTIEDNTFQKNGSGDKGNVGLYIRNSGEDDNMVYRNIFDNLENATVAYGYNRNILGSKQKGLCYKCNIFTNNNSDISVTGTGMGVGIRAEQGSGDHYDPTAPAGNLFTNLGPDTDINNQGALITYWFPFNTSEEYAEPIYVSNVTVSANNYNPWTYEIGCGEGNGGGSGGTTGEFENLMAGFETEAEETQASINLLLDGGDTDATLQYVESSYPPEAYEVYNDLMNKSPYLSDEVVDASIEKDEVLPNVMIRDVMVANPQSAKEDALIDKLEERAEPMPDYMKAQILQGRDLISYMETLESQRDFYYQKRTLTFNNLVRFILEDEVLSTDEKIDELINVYAAENSLYAQYRLAMLYFVKGDYAFGQSLLDAIPTNFELNDNLAQNHNNFVEVYALSVEITQIGQSLTENQIALLQSIEQEANGLASSYARNLLLAFDEIEYIEPVVLPDFNKSAEAQEEYENLMQALKEHHYINVSPNPAKDYTIVEYELEMDPAKAGQEVEITIFESKGIMLKSYPVNNMKDQLVVNTNDFSTGIYIISLWINASKLESIKLNVIK